MPVVAVGASEPTLLIVSTHPDVSTELKGYCQRQGLRELQINAYET